ncbi:MAG TPA: 50S ribosomal protein L15 [Paracoccaceae bacterium]|nr:50S ribosomal protein L15 [Paracoccaceae bacterium]
MRLNELRDNPGAAKPKKRRGRGAGSGLGKMGGRGIKGQKSRRGVAIKGFEGGQMPIHRRLPKRGFNNPFARQYAVTNLGKIQEWIDAGRLDASAVIDAAALVESGLIRRKLDGVRLLAKGELTAKGLTIEVAGASKSAIAAVEAAGGKVTITEPVTESAEAANGAGTEAETGAQE